MMACSKTDENASTNEGSSESNVALVDESSTEKGEVSSTSKTDNPSGNIPKPNGKLENEDLRHLTTNKISLTTKEKIFVVTLYDNPTAADLYAKLPMTIGADDYAGYDEKVLRLEEGLSMEDAPKGGNPMIPELGYYEPGMWIAIYFGPIGYWSGKVPLGQIDATIDELENIAAGDQIVLDVYND